MDTLTKPERSRLMSRVRSADTKPEMVVRRLVHGLGYRYRLHKSNLPGTPDLVFASRRKVIFVHGCFWHRHLGCSKTRTPKSRKHFWRSKFRENTDRDQRNQQELSRLGWRYLIVWECETEKPETLVAKLDTFLRS